jgi:hypothetical protein
MPNLNIGAINVKLVGRKFLEDSAVDSLVTQMNDALPKALIESGLEAAVDAQGVKMEFVYNKDPAYDHWGIDKHNFKDAIVFVIDRTQILHTQSDFILAVHEKIKKSDIKPEYFVVLAQPNNAVSLDIKEHEVKGLLNTLGLKEAKLFVIGANHDPANGMKRLCQELINSVIKSRNLNKTIDSFHKSTDTLLVNLKEEVKNIFGRVYLYTSWYNPLTFFTQNNSQRAQDILNAVEAAQSLEAVYMILDSQKKLFGKEEVPKHVLFQMPRNLQTPIDSYRDLNKSGCYRAISQALLKVAQDMEGLEVRYKPSM